jgi:hypothetical protein
MFGNLGSDIGTSIANSLSHLVPTIILLVIVAMVARAVITGIIRSLPMGKIVLVVCAMLLFGVLSVTGLQHGLVAIIVFFAKTTQLAFTTVVASKT